MTSNAGSIRAADLDLGSGDRHGAAAEAHGGMMSNLLTGSERARLDPFVGLADDGISMRDQRDLMSQPFFSLAKGRRTAPILYEAGGYGSRFTVFPSTAWQRSGMPMC
jgi:hypothetical protein